jgi:outer membrane protein assembly factor BamB
VLAFDLGDGKLKWRYRVPFDFEIKHAAMSGNLLVLAGDAETVALHLGAEDPRGEVVWQAKEEGDLYVAPYFHGDRLVGVRQMPFNLTVRYRATGKLIGRLALPDLTLFDEHPLLERGAGAIPVARDGSRLALSDGFYYLLLDVARMKVIWKRLIDENDLSREPPMRLELNGDYLAVIKQDYDVKTLYMLSSRTGDILWQTDPEDAGSPKPIHSMFIRDGRLFGIEPYAGQVFYFVGLDCKTGKPLFQRNEQTGYQGKPEVELLHAAYGDCMVARVRDRRDFELKAFSLEDGRLLHELKVEAVGDFDEHGRASATVQDGRLLLLGRNTLLTAVEE